VVFLNDHEDANSRAIQAAFEETRRSHRSVTLLVGTDSGVLSKDLESVARALGVQEADLRVRALPSTDPVAVASILRQERAVQLVLSRDCTLLQEPGAEQLLVALNLPVTVTP
jgi:hypothetical protein